MSLLLNTFLNSDILTVLLGLFMPIWAIVLIIIHAAVKKNDGRMWGWRLLCLVPAVLCVVHFILHMVHGEPVMTVAAYLFLYASAIPFILWLFFANRTIGHRVVAVIVMLLLIPCAGAASLQAMMTRCYNFSDQSYTESFKSLISVLKKEYVLADWKELDFDAIQAELMPLVEEADAKDDGAKFGEALQRLCYAVHDDHVTFGMDSRYGLDELKDNLAGDDHGFIMMTLSNGDTAAYMVDESSDAYKAGIRSGTVIKKWNGVDVNKAKSEIECVYTRLSNFAVKDNEEMFRALMLAGTGGETVEVTFMENGKEKTASVKSTGSYAERLNEAIAKFNHQLEDEDYMADNFGAKMLDDHTGYLRVTCESYKTLKDILNLFGDGDYAEVRELVRSNLDDLKAQGMTSLVVDIRNNGGGVDEISGAVASMFTDEKMFINAMGERKGSSFKTYYKHYLNPDGTYKDMPVVVLTNVGCVSAGDGLAYDLSRCPNVTIMGMTHSAGVNQFTGSQVFLTNGKFTFDFPAMCSIEEDGTGFFVDTKADRVSRNPNDVMIPLTAEAAKMIFEEDKDYEIEFAMDYLRTK